MHPLTIDRYIAVRNSATVPQMSAVWTSSVPSTAAAKEAQSAVRNKKWDNMPDGFHEVMLWKTLTIYDTFAITTACSVSAKPNK